MNDTIYTHYKRADPVIYKLMKDIDYSTWFEKKNSTDMDYFYSLCRSIIGQQLSVKAARAINAKFTEIIPDKNLTPEAVLNLQDQTIRDAGLSWAKIKYIKDLADKTLSKELSLSKLTELSEDEVISELTKVKGIGRWTAEMFLMFTLMREDVFSFGDLGLKKGIMKVYNLEEPTEKRISEIIAPWAPYKTYGSIALWESLES